MADLEVAPEFKDAYGSYDHSDPALLNKLAGNFTVLPNDNPVSSAKRNELIDKPAFGQIFSDNMAVSYTHLTLPTTERV